MTLLLCPLMRRFQGLALCVSVLVCAYDAPAQGSSQTDGHETKSCKKRKAKKNPRKKKKTREKPVASLEASHHTPSLPLTDQAIHCPEDMVAVGGKICIDRYESTLADAHTDELLSPYYPPSAKLTSLLFAKWSAAREEAEEGSLASSMALPPIPLIQQTTAFQPKAIARPQSIPSGYVSGAMAAEACHAAGKRLCTESEWVTACRGEKQTQFPYGEHYQQDACNVFREDHPAHILHGEFSVGLSDPRLNQITLDGEPLLRATGASSMCKSTWGGDAIYDMVGNLDEWLDDPEGTFVGGFYARATRSGCDARVSAHAMNYFDYSTGVRCCAPPTQGASEI